MDKFSLVRLWQPTPRLGADLAYFSRKFFFTITVVAFAVVSSFTFAQYPYDKLCEPLDPTKTADLGPYTNVLRLNGEKVVIWENGQKQEVEVLEIEDPVDYISCGQNFRAWAGLPLPATPRVQTGSAGWFASVEDDDIRWMSDEQVRIRLTSKLLSSLVPNRNFFPSQRVLLHAFMDGRLSLF